MSADENVKYEYIFEWKIENFRYCWQKKDEPIFSPVFSAESFDNTQWKLALFPKGDDVKYVGYFLYRNTNGRGPPNISVFYDLIFLKADDSVFERNSIEHTFYIKTSGFGFDKFVEREMIFSENKTLFLPEDTLTVRCKLRKSCEKATKVVELFARTVIVVEQKSFDWNIDEFHEMEPDEKKSLSIKLCSDDELSLDLSYLSVEKLILISISPSLYKIKFMTVKLFLKDTEGKMTECGMKEIYKDLEQEYMNLPLIFTSNIFKKKHLYLKDEELTFCCVCTFTTGIVFEGIGRTISRNYNEYSRYESSENLSGTNTEEKNTRDIKNDIKSLYKDITLSDTTLCTQTSSYPAHIAVLSARSPVFKAMFTSDMKEKIQRKVDILDMKDDTLQRMLLYMYTDTVENLQWESALLLYKAADKYDVMSLKNQCASFIEELLTPTNVCEAFVLANVHRDENFKTTLQNYIINNQNVLHEEEWKLFMKSHSELAAEILFQICMEE